MTALMHWVYAHRALLGIIIWIVSGFLTYGLTKGHMLKTLRASRQPYTRGHEVQVWLYAIGGLVGLLFFMLTSASLSAASGKSMLSWRIRRP